MCQNVEVYIRAWECVAERGSIYNRMEVCIRTWEYI